MILQARAVSADRFDDLECVVVVFAENPDGSGERLELQRGIEFDEQDRSSGMDTYCVCLADGQTAYGGIRRATLGARSLSLELAPETAELLGIADVVRVEFDASRALLLRVRQELTYIFSVDRQRPELVGLGEEAD